MFERGETPAVEELKETPGLCNGVPFTTFEDSDPRIGPNLEVFMAGSYVWIPTGYLRRVEIEPPSGLRDLMWARARVETTPEFRFQELGEVLLPMLAPLSYRHPEEIVQLGREAAWEADETVGQIPFGAKLMVIDGEDVPLANIRSLEWTTQQEQEQDQEATDASA
jgi:type VI secretion system protein ImpE